jgi:hypothetical protein
MNRRHALMLLGIATVAFTVILELIDPSHVWSGPTILAFEFAGRSSRAQRKSGPSASESGPTLSHPTARSRMVERDSGVGPPGLEPGTNRL